MCANTSQTSRATKSTADETLAKQLEEKNSEEANRRKLLVNAVVGPEVLSGIDRLNTDAKAIDAEIGRVAKARTRLCGDELFQGSRHVPSRARAASGVRAQSRRRQFANETRTAGRDRHAVCTGRSQR